MKFTKEQIKALACAVAVLDKTDGGYSNLDKSEAKEELLKLFQIAVRDFKE